MGHQRTIFWILIFCGVIKMQRLQKSTLTRKFSHLESQRFESDKVIS